MRRRSLSFVPHLDLLSRRVVPSAVGAGTPADIAPYDAPSPSDDDALATVYDGSDDAGGDDGGSDPMAPGSLSDGEFTVATPICSVNAYY